MALSAFIVALMPGGAVPTSARLLFQSPGQSPLATPTLPPPTPIPPEPTPELPTPEPPTATPEPPAPTIEPPTATPPAVEATPEPAPLEPATATPEPAVLEPTPTVPLEPEPVVPSEPEPQSSPTPETLHLPALESGGEPEQPASPADSELAATQGLSAESSDRPDTAQVIDGLVVILSYVWLGCGALLLLFVPVGLLLMNRWGKRQRG